MASNVVRLEHHWHVFTSTTSQTGLTSLTESAIKNCCAREMMVRFFLPDQHGRTDQREGWGKTLERKKMKETCFDFMRQMRRKWKQTWSPWFELPLLNIFEAWWLFGGCLVVVSRGQSLAAQTKGPGIDSSWQLAFHFPAIHLTSRVYYQQQDIPSNRHGGFELEWRYYCMTSSLHHTVYLTQFTCWQSIYNEESSGMRSAKEVPHQHSRPGSTLLWEEEFHNAMLGQLLIIQVALHTLWLSDLESLVTSQDEKKKKKLLWANFLIKQAYKRSHTS